MLRINQLAKELGISSHEVIDILEKHLGIFGKSHSSNLSNRQVKLLRSVYEDMNDDVSKNSLGTKVLSDIVSTDNLEDKNFRQNASMNSTFNQTAVLIKKIESIVSNNLVDKSNEFTNIKDTNDGIFNIILKDNDTFNRDNIEPNENNNAFINISDVKNNVTIVQDSTSKIKDATLSIDNNISNIDEISVEAHGTLNNSNNSNSNISTLNHNNVKHHDALNGSEQLLKIKQDKIEQTDNGINEKLQSPSSEFSHLRISTPVTSNKVKEPARYINLPKVNESKFKQQGIVKSIQKNYRNNYSQPINLSEPDIKREIQNSNISGKRDSVQQVGGLQNKRRIFIPPSATELRSDAGFTRIKMSDTPIVTSRSMEPARYIQLPQPNKRPVATGVGVSTNVRTSNPTSRNSVNSNRQRSSRTVVNTTRGNSAGNRSRRNPLLSLNVPPDLSMSKGPGRSSNFASKKKDNKRSRNEKLAEELELKLRQPRSHAQQVATEYVEDEIGIVMLSEGVTVKELAEKCNRPVKDVVAKLLHRGILATINQSLETDLAKEIAREFGYLSDIVSFEEDVQIIADESRDVLVKQLSRPPIVTIMGHVDHGKTSLLDAIRASKIVDSEIGGITQAIGAYHVDIPSTDQTISHRIVFIDTPGHEAFAKMRARGAKVTDIVILVVAADDGIMPQTIEAINHAKAANVAIVVAINKIDKIGADPEKVEMLLLQHGVQTEKYGGDVPCVYVSAKTRKGLDVLLDTVILIADLKDLKAAYDCQATGKILEARLDRGRGPVATVIIQRGTLRVGDIFVAGATMGRVRAMFDDNLVKIKEATPSVAVQILGFEEVPTVGDNFQVIENEHKAKSIVDFRHDKMGLAAQTKQRMTLENVLSVTRDNCVKELLLIIKGNTQGSVESIVSMLEHLSNENIKIRIIHAAAGTVTENDVLLAEASKASIIAFSVKAERNVEDLAHEGGIEIRFYDTIYKVTEDITKIMSGLLDKTNKEIVNGLATVKQIFKVGKNIIAGVFVVEGKIRNNYTVRVKRGDDVVWDGKIKTLKRFKDNIHEVKSGLECGIELDGFSNIKDGDYIEAYTLEKVTV